MVVREKVVVVTGGASGIGLALCRRFAAEGARAIVVADISPAAETVARELRGTAVVADVSTRSGVEQIVSSALEAYGSIDLFCSNAGISVRGSFETIGDADWQRIWDTNLMAHVHAARAVLPSMLAAGHGYLLQTASAAGLLTQIGSAPYAVTKHAAVAFAEWLAVTYGDRGIKVSCLCPQGVRTPMLASAPASVQHLLGGEAIDTETVADAVVKGLEEERFLILPHPEVGEYFRRKAGDYDRWLKGMRRLQAKVEAAP